MATVVSGTRRSVPTGNKRMSFLRATPTDPDDIIHGGGFSIFAGHIGIDTTDVNVGLSRNNTSGTDPGTTKGTNHYIGAAAAQYDFYSFGSG